MKGRKPIPTALKVLKGTDQPCRVNKKDTSSPVVTKVPPPPRWFTKLGKKIYKDVTRQLAASKVLTPADLEMLVAYCQEYSTYLEIMEQFNTGDEDRVVTVATKAGISKQVNPLFKIAQASLEKAKSIGVEYGLTPSSRARVNPVKEQDEDPFQEFLKQKR